jgi:hypothetical protein
MFYWGRMPLTPCNSNRSKTILKKRLIGVVDPDGRVETSTWRRKIDPKVGPAILSGGFGFEIKDGVMDVELIARKKTWLLLAKYLNENRGLALRSIILMFYDRRSGRFIDSPDNPVVIAIGVLQTTIARTLKVADLDAAIERIRQFATKPIRFRKPTFEA